MAQKYLVKSVLVLKGNDCNDKSEPNPLLDSDTGVNFHIRLIESHSLCELYLNHHYVALAPFDVILLSSAQPLTLQNLGAPAALTVFTERVHAPSPLNLVVVGDNPMVHDLMNAGETEPHFIVYRHQDNQLKHRYFALLAELEQQDLTDVFLDYQREMTVGLLLTELLRDHERTISVADSDFPGQDIRHASADTKSGIIFNYLVSHSQTATLKGTAAYFGYDKNYFSRLCRRLFNKSFTEQLAFIRIELAKRMLALSSKGIKEIADELGYKNMSSFFALFKRAVRMTPGDYRQTHGYHQAQTTSPRHSPDQA